MAALQQPAPSKHWHQNARLRNQEICRRAAAGEKRLALAADFGVTVQRIGAIIRESEPPKPWVRMIEPEDLQSDPEMPFLVSQPSAQLLCVIARGARP